MSNGWNKKFPLLSLIISADLLVIF